LSAAARARLSSSQPPSAAVSRRGLLRLSAAASAAAALSGCAAYASRPAAKAAGVAPATPTPAAGTTTIVFYAKPPNASVSSTTIIGIMQEVLQPYYAKTKGVYVRLIPEELPTSQIVTGILSNQQMDIIYDNYFAPYGQQELVVPLEPYFQRDNVDPSIWNTAQYQLYVTHQGPMAVPVYTGTSVIAVNEKVFDDAGLPYPDPTWTPGVFARTCAQLAQPGKRPPVYGGTIFWYTGGPSQQASWVFRAFGGNQVSPTGAPSQLSSPPNQAALAWMYEDLFWPKVAVPQDVAGISQFAAGSAAMIDMDTWELLSFAEGIKGATAKFDFVPYPVFPNGRATFCTADFYAIAANCQHVDAAWDLLRWVSVEPQWQQATFAYALRSPALNSLWAHWEATIQSVVPFFKGKNFSWFSDAAQKGYAYPVEYYPYNDQQVWGLIGPYFSSLYARRIPTVQEAAAQIDQVVNAFEAAAQGQAGAQANAAKRFPTNGRAIATVPSGL
jgi:multiple sugar transport system substrate-binding protein